MVMVQRESTVSSTSSTGPAGIAPRAECPPRFCLELAGNVPFEVILRHVVQWPLSARIDGQTGPAKKPDGFSHRERIDGCRQVWQVRRVAVTGLPVQGADEVGHMPGGQVHVFLHLLLFSMTQVGEALHTLPELLAEVGRSQLPLGPLLYDGSGGFQRQQVNRLL